MTKWEINGHEYQKCEITKKKSKESNNLIINYLLIYMRKTKTSLLNKKKDPNSTSCDRMEVNIKVLYDVIDLKIESKDELKYLILSTAQKTLGQLRSSMLNFSLDKTSDDSYKIQIDKVSYNLFRTILLLIGNGVKVLII